MDANYVDLLIELIADYPTGVALITEDDKYIAVDIDNKVLGEVPCEKYPYLPYLRRCSSKDVIVFNYTGNDEREKRLGSANG